MTALGGVGFGLLGDRIGRKPVIVATTLIYGIGTLLCASAHSLGALVAWRTVAGLGIGGEWAAGQSMIAETIPAQYRARYACYVQTGAPLGILLAAMAGRLPAARNRMARGVRSRGLAGAGGRCGGMAAGCRKATYG